MDATDTRTIISGLALGVSIVSLAGTIWTARRSRLWNIRPTLAFSYRREEGWLVENVGNGAALDVSIEAKVDGEPLIDPRPLPPLPRGARVPLEGIGHDARVVLVAAYRDVAGGGHETRWDGRHTLIDR